MSDRYGFADADLMTIKEEIRTILIQLARSCKTITYSNLCARIQTAYMHHRAPGFHYLLRELCRDEISAGRPVIGVVVVNKQTGRCGAGYFKFAAQMGADVSDPETYWNEEFERVCEYWGEAE
ncbi:MAG: hypothetical protein RLP44_16890 [Aggregatilineales bacterium]